MLRNLPENNRHPLRWVFLSVLAIAAVESVAGCGSERMTGAGLALVIAWFWGGHAAGGGFRKYMASLGFALAGGVSGMALGLLFVGGLALTYNTTGIGFLPWWC